MTKKYEQIKAIHFEGMVNIDSESLRFCNIGGFYRDRDGFGLQVEDETKRKKAEELCNEIADKLYALNELLTS